MEKEFRLYLDCNQLVRGFALLRCKSCGYEQLMTGKGSFTCRADLDPRDLWRAAEKDLSSPIAQGIG